MAHILDAPVSMATPMQNYEKGRTGPWLLADADYIRRLVAYMEANGKTAVSILPVADAQQLKARLEKHHDLAARVHFGAKGAPPRGKWVVLTDDTTAPAILATADWVSIPAHMADATRHLVAGVGQVWYTQDSPCVYRTNVVLDIVRMGHILGDSQLRSMEYVMRYGSSSVLAHMLDRRVLVGPAATVAPTHHCVRQSRAIPDQFFAYCAAHAARLLASQMHDALTRDGDFLRTANRKLPPHFAEWANDALAALRAYGVAQYDRGAGDGLMRGLIAGTPDVVIPHALDGPMADAVRHTIAWLRGDGHHMVVLPDGVDMQSLVGPYTMILHKSTIDAPMPPILLMNEGTLRRLPSRCAWTRRHVKSCHCFQAVYSLATARFISGLLRNPADVHIYVNTQDPVARMMAFYCARKTRWMRAMETVPERWLTPGVGAVIDAPLLRDDPIFERPLSGGTRYDAVGLTPLEAYRALGVGCGRNPQQEPPFLLPDVSPLNSVRVALPALISDLPWAGRFLNECVRLTPDDVTGISYLLECLGAVFVGPLQVVVQMADTMAPATVARLRAWAAVASPELYTSLAKYPLGDMSVDDMSVDDVIGTYFVHPRILIVLCLLRPKLDAAWDHLAWWARLYGTQTHGELGEWVDDLLKHHDVPKREIVWV